MRVLQFLGKLLGDWLENRLQRTAQIAKLRSMEYALSIKQPWAALLVHGRKTIEIRRWSTSRRGRVLIHAARLPDERPEAWTHVTPDIEPATRLHGGVIGEAELIQCNVYRSLQAFADHQAYHLNHPDWFRGSTMYGFVFARARPLPFQACTGALHFFEVPDAAAVPVVPTVPVERRTPSGLLVSVRSVAEAEAALEGGADLIDVKEPRHGPLGRAQADVIAGVVKCIAGRRPVSAAWGELADLDDAPMVPELTFVKCGLARLSSRKRWQRQLEAFQDRLAAQPQPPEVVTVAYADWVLARAPEWLDVARFALRQRGGTLLLDTFDKQPHTLGNERRVRTLLDWLTSEEIYRLCDDCRAAGVHIALAGALRNEHILKLLDARPTWFAVRGAVCAANDRDGAVHVLKVCSLAELLRWKQQPPPVEG
jgi:uncharacterized protein (UPF0264 family)